MISQNGGSFPLFKLKGIQVSVHWTWFVALYILYKTSGLDESLGWFLATYLSLFGIVLMHEFGHAFACRSVGGEAGNIVLWPLGGIAFVRPPQRPGALLWSIAAGPLVNVVLVPITVGLVFMAEYALPPDQFDGLRQYVYVIFAINLMLLIFNVMPVYPLDGGQMLQAILWYFIGRAKSLRVVAFIGVVMAVVVGVLAFMVRDWWLVLIAVFVFMQAWRGLKIARLMAMYGQ